MRLRTLLLCLLALLIASAGMASLVARAQNESSANNQNNASNEKASPSGAAFVIYMNAQGEATCRVATPSERRQIMQRSGESRVIYAGAPRRDATSAKDLSPNAPPANLPNLLPSAGLRIVLHGTTQLDQPQNQAAKNAFIVAANRWEALISTPVTVVLDVDFGTTFFGTPYPSADIIGATGTAEDTQLYSEVRDRLLANSPTAAESQLYNALPVGSVPTELSGNAFKSLTVRLSQANERALGFVSDIADPNAIPLGGGDAGIGFNSAFAFDFDPSDGIDSNKIDFDSVATHEIGHALGFISESGGPVYAPTAIWDVFRFRPGAASIGTLGTAPRIMSAGGTQVYFNGQTNTFGTQELSLSTGGPDGTAGDGNQSSHWKDDDITFQYIGIMDPTIDFGERNPITANDVKTIDSFGYSTGSPVPGPPPPPSAPPLPPNDNFANATVIQDVAGATTGNSTGATKELGEPVMLPTPPAGAGGKSVWYRWTSPVDGTATFDTEGSGFDTILAVSTGNSVGSLTRLSQNDDLAPGETTSSRVTFLVTAGVTYQLAVDGFDNGAGPESGLIELNWSATGGAPTPTPTPGSCTPGNKLQDPGFEASTGAGPITNPFWPSTSTQFGTSLCSAAVCGSVASAVPRNGTYWAWFGGTDGPETGTVSQAVTIPSGGTATLNYFLRIGAVAAPFTDVLNVKVDGTTVQSFTEPSAAEASYTLRSVNLDAFANGAPHTILFEYMSPTGGGIANFNVDDVTLDVTCPTSSTVQFDASIYTPSENIGSQTVMVTRTGDTSGSSTVNYTTSDTAGANNCNALNTGNASSRCDYETTAGTLRFASGQTSKNILLPIVDDAFAEGSENFTVTLSNPSGAILGSPSTATVTILDNETTTGANPIDTASFFVRLHYIDFLNREPDAGGLAFWTNQITSCTDQACVEIRRINVSAAFFLSIEFQETGYLVYRVYKAAYGNVPGLPVPVRLNEFLPDTQQIGQGVVVGQTGWEQVLENNKQAFATEFVTRSRFTSAFPTTLTPAQFVDALFANAGVTPAPADRATAISEFGSATDTANTGARGRALRRVAENSTLHQQEFNRAFVLMQYFGYLRRNPDDPPEAGLNFDGYNFWLGKLNQFNGNFVNAEMVKAFIVSGEYKGRFGP